MTYDLCAVIKPNCLQSSSVCCGSSVLNTGLCEVVRYGEHCLGQRRSLMLNCCWIQGITLDRGKGLSGTEKKLASNGRGNAVVLASAS